MSQPNYYGQPQPSGYGQSQPPGYGQPQPQGYGQPVGPQGYGQPASSVPAPGFADPQPAGPQAGWPGYAEPAPANLVPAQNYHQPPTPQYGAVQAGPHQAGPMMVQLGGIVVTPTHVLTPAGEIPLREATFTFLDQTFLTRKTPTWAVVMAVVGFFFLTLFSLLFLLAKENVLTGQVVVGVFGAGVNYQEPLLVTDAAQVADVVARVNYANNLAAQI